MTAKLKLGPEADAHNKECGRRFALWRERLGLTQTDLAMKMRVPQSAISEREDGKTAINVAFLFAAADAADTSVDDFYESMKTRKQTPKLPQREASIQLNWPAQMLADHLPIFNISRPAARITVLSGSPANWTPRPPILLNVADAYAVYMTGRHMMPRFRPGQRLYVNPHQPPAAGNGIVLYLHDHSISIRHYLDETNAVIRNKQYTPRQVFETARTDLDAMHTIVALDDA